MMTYSQKEMMAIAAAREIKNNDIVFCGTGISMIAAMAARHISAPESIIVFETGAIDSQLEEVPLAVGDPRVMFHTSSNGSLIDSFSILQNRFTGKRVVGILGAAQIDKYGNLNSTVIGDYNNPDIRFSGSGGACDMASHADRSIIFMQHKKNKFVETLDYFTSPGWINGPGGRKDAGYPENGSGPLLVITDLAVLGFKNETREIYLKYFYPGISIDKIINNTGFNIDVSKATKIPAPSDKELSILREKCDPQGLIV